MANQKLLPVLFSLTLFLSAALVFSVQPMLGKMMLPFVGGAPSGWAVAMFFFQTCLLAGYTLAYLLSKLPPFLNTIAILLLFIPGIFFLPIVYQGGTEQTISPFVVFIQLTMSAAMPFLTLSTLAPGLQRLFSFSTHNTAGDPYYLYAASNIGSFVGLLSYPFILEPLVGLDVQSYLWMVLYGVLFMGVFLCALTVFLKRKELINFSFSLSKPENNLKTIAITWKQRLNWVILAAIPSSLMLGVTTEIITDIASMPMLWILPLGLYLITNIVAFSKGRKPNIKSLGAWHLMGVATIFIYALSDIFSVGLAIVSVPMMFIYLIVFTITALLLHMQLANSRPQTEKLTEFFVILALGGALGGSFNAFIAPVIFNDAYEFQIALILSLLLNPAIHEAFPEVIKKLVKTIGLVCITIGAIILISPTDNNFICFVLMFLLFFSVIQIRLLVVMCIIAFTVVATPILSRDYIHINRNFFGVTKVYDGKITDSDETAARIFVHGTTIHGFQAKDENHAHKPQVYYGTAGPVGDVLAVYNPRKVALLGLGTGQLSCHNRSGREFTYYEIDPHVVEIAKTYFTQLEECGYKDIIIGDARLELKKQKEKYDVIFVDTFSSDSIPVHLVTTEALELYFDKLNKGGLVVINISNRHLSLAKPISATAKEKDYLFRVKTYMETEDKPYDLSSQWAILTKNQNVIDRLDRKDWLDIETKAKPWTDNYSNLLSTLKMFDIKGIIKSFKEKETEETDA